MTRWSQLILIDMRWPTIDLIAVVNDWDFCDLANGENEALRRIDDSGETVDAHAAEI